MAQLFALNVSRKCHELATKSKQEQKQGYFETLTPARSHMLLPAMRVTVITWCYYQSINLRHKVVIHMYTAPFTLKHLKAHKLHKYFEKDSI